MHSMLQKLKLSTDISNFLAMTAFVLGMKVPKAEAERHFVFLRSHCAVDQLGFFSCTQWVHVAMAMQVLCSHCVLEWMGEVDLLEHGRLCSSSWCTLL